MGNRESPELDDPGDLEVKEHNSKFEKVGGADGSCYKVRKTNGKETGTRLDAVGNFNLVQNPSQCLKH